MKNVRPSPLAPQSEQSPHLEYSHQPVFLEEVLKFLQPQSGFAYIDATLGGGGHTSSILQANVPSGVVVGIDSNPKAIAYCEKKFLSVGKRFVAIKNNFRNLKQAWEQSGVKLELDGALFDLGLSSAELAESDWGFSFQTEAPLLMRYDADPEGGLTAYEVVNHWSADQLVEVLRTYGEEPLARLIVTAIIRNRPIANTAQLADLIVRVYARRYGHSRRHPATKTFQALRIVVNDELNALSEALTQATDLLRPGGKLVVISYHSLEDGLVKRFIKGNDRIKAQFKKPLVPSEAEQVSNPRSRSAKLRAAIKL